MAPNDYNPESAVATAPAPRTFAKGATVRHTGTSHLGIRAHGSRNVTTRFRITKATARKMADGSLIDIFENSQANLRQHEKLGTLGPAKLAWHKRVRGIVRCELLRRGFEADALDYDPEAHIEEAAEPL